MLFSLSVSVVIVSNLCWLGPLVVRVVGFFSSFPSMACFWA